MPGERLNDRKSNILHLICTCVFFLGVCILCVCGFSTSGNLDRGAKSNYIEPKSVTFLEDGSKKYEIEIPSKYSGCDRLRFYTAHQRVHAYNGEELIYSFDKKSDFWGSTPGSKYNFIKLESGVDIITVVVTPVYECVENQKITFYIGKSEELINELMRDSLPKFIASILMVIMAVGIFSYYIFMVKRQNLTKDMFYLSLFSLIMGMWSLNETDMSSIITINRIFDSVVPYICMLLIVPTFVIFIYNYLGIADRFVHKLILCLCILEFFLLNILHFTQVAEFRETLFIIQITLLMSAVYLFSAVLIKVVNRQYSRRLHICIIGLGLFAFAMISDLIAYYRALGDADLFGRYVFLVFAALLTWDLVKGTNDIIIKGRKAKELEVFAITDSMTGLYNRNAFEMHMARPGDEKDIVVIMTDLNDLKFANDTYGHDVGDEYIIEIAEIISDLCAKSGNCYRTGGDEFCVVMHNISNGTLDRMIRAIGTRVQSLNNKSKYDFKFEVAIGTARYDEAQDKDIYSVVKRADMAMYENKKALKARKGQSLFNRL